LLMGQAVTFEQRERESAAQRDTGSAPAAPAGGTASDAPGSAEEPTFRPIFRKIEAGEQRTEGTLERITCAASGALLEVRSDGALLKFAVSRLDQVDFISYRQTLTGAIGCGARTPADHVYVTWRESGGAAPAAPGTRGRAVAVEFLPK
jgi:hypothetical protein